MVADREIGFQVLDLDIGGVEGLDALQHWEVIEWVRLVELLGVVFRDMSVCANPESSHA